MYSIHLIYDELFFINCEQKVWADVLVVHCVKLHLAVVSCVTYKSDMYGRVCES